MSIKAPAAKYNNLNIRTKNTIKLPLVIDGVYKKICDRVKMSIAAMKTNYLHMCVYL